MTALRTSAVARVRSSTARVTTVWGLPGVGKTWVMRSALQEIGIAWVDALDLDVAGLVRASGDRTVWDGVAPEVARETLAHCEGRVWITSCGRTRVDGEEAIELEPLDSLDAEGLLETQFRQRGFDVVPPGLAAACLGLPILLERACDLYELIGRLPRPSDWLDAPGAPGTASLDDALRGVVAGLDATALSALQVFSAFSDAFDLGAARTLAHALPLGAVRANRDHSTLQLVHPGRFRVHPLIRAYVRARWSKEMASIDALRFADLGGRARAAWGALERTGAPPRMQEDSRDLVRTVTARADGWEHALAIAVLEAPRSVPPDVLDAAVSADHALVWRARSRHRRAIGDNERALLDLERPAARDDPGASRERAALLHRMRRCDAARAAYLQCLKSVPPGRASAVTRANLAALDHDEMRLEEARQGYSEAIVALRLLGDERLAGLFASNLGALELEQGRHAHAERALRRAVRQLERAGDGRLLAIALGNLAWVAVETRRMDRASELLGRALDQTPDFRTEITLRARLGAVQALVGDLGGSHATFEATTGPLLTADDWLAGALVELYRGFFDIGSGDRAAASARLAAARTPDEGRPLVAVSDDARVGARWLERMLLEAPGPRLVVGPGGEWAVLPDRTRVDFSKHGAVQRILQRLALHRIGAPGAQLTVEALFEAGWPGATIQISSARNRVHVALNKLRTAGLRACLLRDGSGYLLDPDLPVFVTSERPDHWHDGSASTSA